MKTILNKNTKQTLLLITIFILFNLKLSAQCNNYGQLTGDESGTHAPNYLIGQKYKADNSGKITHLAIKSGESGRQVIMALYTDNAGYPGALVTRSIATTLVTGDNIIEVTEVELAAGDYWIMKILDGTDNTTAVNMKEYKEETTRTYYGPLTFGASLPSSYPTAASSYIDEVFVSWMVVCEEETLGITNSIFRNDLTAYPNPTQGSFSVNLKQNYSNITLKILSIYGQEVYTKNYIDLNKININISNLISGVYILEIINDKNETTTLKIVKQ